MLIRKHDAATDEDEWRTFLVHHDFGQFIASGRGRDVPVIVPTHFIFDGDQEISFHLARANPVWEALEQNPHAVMSVVSAYHYIPTDVNSGGHEPPMYGVPTSYYAAVQATGSCRRVDGEELAEILTRQLRHFEPSGAYAEPQAGDNPYGRQFAAIKGIVVTIEEVRAKFKFGGNKTVEHRLSIADWLDRQQSALASEARQHLLTRMQPTSHD